MKITRAQFLKTILLSIVGMALAQLPGRTQTYMRDYIAIDDAGMYGTSPYGGRKA